MNEPYPARLAVFDVLTVSYLAGISLLTTVFADRLVQWWWYPLTHLLAATALLLFVLYYPPKPASWLLCLRYWYPVAFIIPIFSELQYLVHSINPLDIDAKLMAIDLALFGVHPTVWLEHYTVPWLTEYMQIMYTAFYFLPFALCVPLYQQRRFGALRESFCALLLGYYLQYSLYFMTPARGPRFFMTTHQTMGLQGLWLAEVLQHTLDSLEGMQRDAFPSGHTAIAVSALILAIRHQSRLVPSFVVIVGSMLVSTVYLRYHYVIDVIGGIGLAALCLGVTFWLYRPRLAATYKS